ncbi:hypothetical membrane protein (plasmid) [Bartonella grahamii as4aup]|uniref:Hypothetical membrane protein n=1 Tax=Bartonella grahamii (strain as4aup) TaxID=634504 RepID=C6AF31_BARGA|nr:hypothetical protein [Bartonella grahamii]ACS52157.1 hypothetical membrane protein [Bartonella grahamii as4aup]
MDTLSTNKLNKKEKNPNSKQSILITIMRRVFSIVYKILHKILKICLFSLFLFLLLIRKPVIILTEFIAGGSLLVLFIFFTGYVAGSAPFEHQTAMVIGYIVLIFLSLAVNWGYDTLLLRLAPPGSDLMLFK